MPISTGAWVAIAFGILAAMMNLFREVFEGEQKLKDEDQAAKGGPEKPESRKP